MKSKHLRSLRQSALRVVLTRARGTPGTPEYIPQRPFAKHIDRSQPWISLIESLQRRCDVLEFMDFADAYYEDRLELYRQLVALAPRRFKPFRQSKTAAGRKDAAKTSKTRSKKTPRK